MDVLEVSSGTLGTWEIDLLDRDGHPVSFEDTDGLSAVIWAGDDTLGLADPVATWTDAATGRVQVVVPESITGALSPARYLMRLTILTSSGIIEGWRGWIDVKWSPGTGKVLTTYVSYQDLLLYAPQIQRLQLETDQTGFVEQRHLARTWLDSYLQNCWRGSRMISYTSPRLMSYYIYLSRDVWLQSQLDANCLQVDHRVKELSAKRAISYVYDSAIGGDTKAASVYRELANKFLRDSNQLAKTCVFGLTQAVPPNNVPAGDLSVYPVVIIDAGKRDTRF